MKISRRILIVDDDEMTLQLLSFKLRQKFAEVFTACDSFQALQQIGSLQPDLVVLDIMMPGLTGLELLSLVKRMFTSKSIHAIIMSRLNIPGIFALAEKLGAAHFLLKPFEPEQLLEKIYSVPGFQASTV